MSRPRNTTDLHPNSEQAAIADLERIAMEAAQKVAAAKAKLGSASA